MPGKNAPELDFAVEDAAALRFAASPQIAFKLRVSTTTADPIHTVILRCQIQLEPTRRAYTPEEKEHLMDLFGESARWGQTLRSILWINTSVVVPGFTGSTTVDVPVPCTFDFNVSATKYFAGVEGEIPIAFYFGGTVFYSGEAGALQVSQISLEKEATYRMPAGVWREMMDVYYPNTAWLCLSRDVFEKLYEYKTRHGIPTFDEALEVMIR
jgi:hypothetical protein